MAKAKHPKRKTKIDPTMEVGIEKQKKLLRNAKKFEREEKKRKKLALVPDTPPTARQLELRARHPMRKEDVAKVIESIHGSHSRAYATARLAYIWNGGKAPKPPTELKAHRVKELDAILEACFNSPHREK